MNNEIEKFLELLEQEYFSTRSEEEKEELKEVFNKIEDEAKNFVWLS